MQLNPSWEANWFSFSQEIPCTVLNSKVHYQIHECLPPVHILSQINPVHAVPPSSHFLNTHHNITLPFMPESFKWSLSLRFPHQNPVYTTPLPHTCHIPHPSHSSWFDQPNNIWWRVEIIKLLIMLFSQLPVNSSLLGPNPKTNTSTNVRQTCLS